MSKIVFFDIDGTIWDDNMQIPESTARAIAALRENGHRAFICSGRSRGSIAAESLLGLGFDGIVAACGNHIEMDGTVIHENIIAPDMTRKVIDVLHECHMPVVLEGPKYLWIDAEGFEDDPYVDYLYEFLGKAARTLDGYTDDIRINKFSADILENTDYTGVLRELGDSFDALRHVGNVVEFVPKGTSKATGIAWLCEYLGVDIADTYAIGDSVNDLDMLAAVGHGIAMGNALPKAKEAAEYVTTDIHNDGIMNAMRHYGLI
ncbi:MAG: Cof-type HAD-IIB family hydrolase [Clostridiales bacterium]|nr:Cof-type HAD-IIB family hydrolase [Clostridiales bacterium]